jgi:hypothetical protein
MASMREWLIEYMASLEQKDGVEGGGMGQATVSDPTMQPESGLAEISARLPRRRARILETRC